MKAVVLTRLGPPEVLRLQEVEKPVPKENEVLIRINATTVSAGEADLLSSRLSFAFKLIVRIYFAYFRPKPIILGQELAGEIEAAGQAVTRFNEGDQVYGWTGLRLGANAEYLCLPGSGVLGLKPSNMSYEEAATLSVGGLDALFFMRRGNIQRGEKVLINGAGGSIGTYALQLAKLRGAIVTAVDSTGKLDMLRSLGADHVVDYTREDLTRGGKSYDVIFDVVGKVPLSRGLKALSPNGRYLLGNGLAKAMRARWISGRDGKVIISWESRTARQYAEDFKILKELIEAGKLRAVVDRCFPLEQLAEAHRYTVTGQKKGHVVISVGHAGQA